MKAGLMRLLTRLGHFQAQLLLTIVFAAILTPYALLLRLFGVAKLPDGQWQAVTEQGSDLDRLRRTY